MSRIDPDLLDDWQVDNALDADHDDPFAGDDPPADWFPKLMPREVQVGSAFVADARRTDVPFSDEAPF